jgi:hypothetical protein
MTDSFGLSKNAMPQLEVPAEFRQMIDKGVAQARDAYAKAKAAGEEAQPTCSKPPMRPPPRALQATISS